MTFSPPSQKLATGSTNIIPQQPHWQVLNTFFVSLPCECAVYHYSFVMEMVLTCKHSSVYNFFNITFMTSRPCCLKAVVWKIIGLQGSWTSLASECRVNIYCVLCPLRCTDVWKQITKQLSKQEDHIFCIWPIKNSIDLNFTHIHSNLNKKKGLKGKNPFPE